MRLKSPDSTFREGQPQITGQPPATMTPQSEVPSKPLNQNAIVGWVALFAMAFGYAILGVIIVVPYRVQNSDTLFGECWSIVRGCFAEFWLLGLVLSLLARHTRPARIAMWLAVPLLLLLVGGVIWLMYFATLGW